MVQTIESVNGIINGFVWGPVMLLLLVGTGILLTIRAGFPQILKLGTIMKNTVGTLFGSDAHKKDEAGISPYQAVATALASTVGTGNITGVATAIVAGGPGAVFWMWISALFGTMTKFAEVTLAVKYRQKNERGEWVGGPMYYMENGLNMKWLGVIFAVLATLASFGIGNMTQSNSIASALNTTVGI
ncbi:MAG: sodium:alanine symporter family protein, partial [Peptococcaceae bacterium]|nr:sodium:alanine symporter family protein [Peptococcaceae bacterium]